MDGATAISGIGPIVGLESNVVHLAPGGSQSRQDQSQAAAQLAANTRSIATLMGQLSEEVASINKLGQCAGQLDLVEKSTAEFGAFLRKVIDALDYLKVNTSSQAGHSASPEKKAL